MLPPAKFRGRYVRPKTILAATMAVGSLLAVASPASAAAFSFTTIDVPGAIPGSTRAGGINNSGQIVGSFVAGATTHGFLDTGGSFTTIDMPGASGAGTVASGINDAGQIVGDFQDGTTTHGFLKVGGSFTPIDVPAPLPPPGTVRFTVARGINDAGQIVGNFGFGTNAADSHGFLDTGGSFTQLDVPGGFGTAARGINEAGQIVGDFQDSTTMHGFLEVGGSFTTIDVPGARSTSAQGINDAGQIVGYFIDSTGDHGFLDASGSFTIIDVPGTSFTTAEGINNAGQIVGTSESSFAVAHGFLATPVSMVPEPSSLALLSVGVIVLWTIRRRKCRQPIRLRLATTVGPRPARRRGAPRSGQAAFTRLQGG